MENPFVDSKKKSRKLRLIISAAIMIALFVGSVIAINYIVSNPVSVTVGAYGFGDSLEVDNDTPFQYQEITFSGTLYYNGATADAGKTILLFRNDTQVGSGVTNSSGGFSIVYNASVIGTFDFEARFLPS